LLKGFFKRYGWRYIPGLIIMFVSSYIHSKGPLALGATIDIMRAPDPHWMDVWRMAVIIMLIASGSFVTRFIWRLFIVGNARVMENYMREALFKKLQSMPRHFFSMRQTGDLMAYAVNDISAVRATFGPVLALGANGIITGSLAIFNMLSTAGVMMTALAFLPVPITMAILAVLGKRVRQGFGRVQGLFSRVSGQLNETISGAKTIKSFAREDSREADFEKVSGEMKQAGVDLANTSSWMRPIVSMAFGLSYAIALIIGGRMVISGDLSVGGVVTFFGCLALIQTPVAHLAGVVNILQRGLASLKRLNAIFDEPSIPEFEFLDYDKVIHGAIEVRNLSFTYPETLAPTAENANLAGNSATKTDIATATPTPTTDAVFAATTSAAKTKTAVKTITDAGAPVVENAASANTSNSVTGAAAVTDISFSVPLGGRLGVTGSTGSGKTTLVNLLVKLYNPPPNAIFIDGVDILTIPAKAIREAIGFVPQDGFLFSDTVENNIRFFANAAHEDVVRAAEIAQVDGDINSFRDGYDTQIGERGTRISGGQKQRLALARALARKPCILILDDTLSAVDALTEKDILEGLMCERSDDSPTLIIIAHRLSALTFCDRIIYLDGGRIVEQGSHSELMELNGLYAEAFREQQRGGDRHVEG